MYRAEAAAAVWRPDPVLSDRYGEAMAYALALHRDDVRKGSTVPYLAHVLAVSSLVLEHGGTEDQAVAALLHDAAEDKGGEARLTDIADRFGPAVAAIVRACSDDTPEHKDAKRSWVARKLGYLATVAGAPPTAPELLVAAADKLHNTRSQTCDYRHRGPAIWSNFKAGRDGTLWYHNRLVDLFGAKLGERHALVRELAATVRLLERMVGEHLDEPSYDTAAVHAARTPDDLRGLGLPARAWLDRGHPTPGGNCTTVV